MNLEEKWKKLKKIAQETMTKKRIRVTKKELGHRDWWDRNCTRKKKEVQRTYKQWRRCVVSREKYLEEKKKLRDLQDLKQKEKREEELQRLRREADVWKFINKRRGKRVKNFNSIKKNEWSKHCMQLLESTEL